MSQTGRQTKEGRRGANSFEADRGCIQFACCHASRESATKVSSFHDGRTGLRLWERHSASRWLNAAAGATPRPVPVCRLALRAGLCGGRPRAELGHRRDRGLEHALRRTERALQKLLEQKEMLLSEMSHRAANSLQIIASILLMKARTVESAEIRLHLEDAHQRVMSVASVQQHLQASGKGEQIAVGPYLSKLCDALSASMIGDNRSISLRVVAGDGATTSGEAVSLGLIVTELVINALKHAFPDSPNGAHIIVGYEVDGANWSLSISDNGVGMPD